MVNTSCGAGRRFVDVVYRVVLCTYLPLDLSALVQGHHLVVARQPRLALLVHQQQKADRHRGAPLSNERPPVSSSSNRRPPL
jgi:hypothetical protein